MSGLQSYIRYLSGQDDALEELVRAYSDMLVRFAWCYLSDSHAAEEVAEDTLAALIVHRKHFREEAQLRAYLYKTARSRSIDCLRRRGREVPLSDVEEVLAVPCAETEVWKRQRNETLYRCLQQLKSEYREVLYLRYFDDFSPEQICRIMRKSKKQAYNLLSRARVALRELLEKEGISHEDL
jgi:RNA polymerase sigma-70 factor (ECF subfamily)